jgi:serine/threonine protein kinase
MVLRSAVKGWKSASVQTIASDLASVLGDSQKIKSFDVILAGCDFTNDGSIHNPTLAATRALAADPNNPPVILLTAGGSEYTAVQSIKAGAFDCIPKGLLGKEQVIAAIQRALISYRPAQSSDDALASIRLFGYDIRRCLSNHQNVSVHVAFSAERGEEVVLKILHRGRGSLSRDENFERFVGEFKLLYDVDDPAVTEIYDFRVTTQYCYIAMEYFPLGHLGRMLKNPLPPDEALRLTVEIAGALSIIHMAGIVHRDLKPGNVMLRDDGTVALIDFGISESTMSDTSDTQSQLALISGTPYYMSPEQARGEATDERTDLYALGVILYQMLTNEKPYTGTTTEYILEQHKGAPLPALPPHLMRYQRIVDRLLVKDMNHRLASARELIEVVDAVRESDNELDYDLSATSA